MPPAPKIPAPIDRPLSRAYLREFTGWSTAFPPGISEPTSLRIMENTQINRDGSLRIRPGLRFLTYAPAWIDVDGDEIANPQAFPTPGELVGTHEVFFLNDGTKAYLFAVRETDGTVGFRVAKATGEGPEGIPFKCHTLTSPQIGFPTEPDPFAADTTYVKYLQIDNKILALSDGSDSVRMFYVGSEKKCVTPKSIERPNWDVDDKPRVRQPDKLAIDDPVANPPWSNYIELGERTAHTLMAPNADADAIPYSIGYYYTFSNELGEAAASKITVVKPRRRWTAWRWQKPNAASEPDSSASTDDLLKAADQLCVWPSPDAFTTAQAAGATHYNVYAVMWSDQDQVPVEGALVGSTEITSTMTHPDCFVRHTPDPFNESRTMPLPTKNNRRNYSKPPKAGQGIVAADRMVLVNDPAEGAVIRWSTNRAGEFTNFTAHRGGGYKTLTSGNLYIPVAVKLWQNPESKDTLTVLCLGVDGYSASFYMAPASLSGMSDAVQIMAFEETTGTPGTTSPFGVEVLNNTLYHPLETELMKTTASNYNINHKTMTELIDNMWVGLVDKINIVSSQLDNRLYYLVHNPEGEALEDGCWGNEVWVLDTAAEQGTWSRWLTQGHSLRKIEVGGQVVMSLVRPEGIYCFDDRAEVDEFVNADRTIGTRAIPWKVETNTQGANRAHDAPAHLQQVSITFGNFTGSIRYGVRGYDLNGKPVDISKVVHASSEGVSDLPWDQEDRLLIRKDMVEWRFYAESVIWEGVTSQSAGMINLVQYRYTPVSVNVGYEHGSIETFEYGQSVFGIPNNTISGIPKPMIDTRKP